MDENVAEQIERSRNLRELAEVARERARQAIATSRLARRAATAACGQADKNHRYWATRVAAAR